MNLRYEYDKGFKIREKLSEEVIIVKVNKFDESAVKIFAKEFDLAHHTGQPVIPIVIDSYGGQVYSLLAMVDIINSSKIPVATIVEGKAMSCGAILLSCGTEGYRFASYNSTIMIHDVSNVSFGKVEEIKADAKETERLNQLIYKILAKNCQKSDDYFMKEIHERSHAEWFLTAQEALSHNLINKIGIPTLTTSYKIDYNFSL